MPAFRPAADLRYLDQLSRNFYGTDVPTLRDEIGCLRAKLDNCQSWLWRRNKKIQEQKRRLSDMDNAYSVLHRSHQHYKRAWEKAQRKLRRLGHG
ncbi:hypothetical protein Tdes44962_MAKER00276 [Teratosphaeria destructans]|uniref:Uncharacterized protein n=1 Tax=Teratosphaeria destructans TaxID=418781 RepID=A0A9W7SV62_9PEZI|nr:hypothetical protein Tdes44962_MAKER00276 [Teratosphaeria destructans]